MLNLLNAVTLDQKQLIIIAAVAAVLLAVIITIIVCSVRARKKLKERAIAKTNKRASVNVDVSEKIEEDSIVKDEQEQLADEVAKYVEDEPRDEAITAEQTVSDGYLNDGDSTEVGNEEYDDVDEKITEEELEELAATDEDGDDVEEEVTVQLSEEDNAEGDIVFRRIRYNRSFLARITQAGDEVKARYSELKNYLLSYGKVKSAISWKHESFRMGRITFACIVMRGKKLCLRFATDPKRFDDTKYKVIDMSIRSPKSKQPCLYRITSERRVKYAKEIIDLLTDELSVKRLAEPVVENYVMPYRTTETLIEDGLIRVTVIEGVENTETKLDNVDLIKDIVQQTQKLPKRDFKILQKVEVAEVDVMSDAEAVKIIEYKVVKRKKSKGSKGIINIDVLSQKFTAGSVVNIDTLREKRIIPNNVNYIKVLANGILDKPLIIEADDFSLQAVKMIALTGGRVIRTGDK